MVFLGVPNNEFLHIFGDLITCLFLFWTMCFVSLTSGRSGNIFHDIKIKTYFSDANQSLTMRLDLSNSCFSLIKLILKKHAIGR